jgi:hypothetical protein
VRPKGDVESLAHGRHQVAQLCRTLMTSHPPPRYHYRTLPSRPFSPAEGELLGADGDGGVVVAEGQVEGLARGRHQVASTRYSTVTLPLRCRYITVTPFPLPAEGELLGAHGDGGVVVAEGQVEGLARGRHHVAQRERHLPQLLVVRQAARPRAVLVVDLVGELVT